jgi:hypothetical protein
MTSIIILGLLAACIALCIMGLIWLWGYKRAAALGISAVIIVSGAGIVFDIPPPSYSTATLGATTEYAFQNVLSEINKGVEYNSLFGEYLTPASNGRLQTIKARLAYTTAQDEATAGIYTSAKTKIATTNEVSVTSTTAAWYTFTFASPPRILAGSYYYIMVYGDCPPPGANAVYLKINTTDSGTGDGQWQRMTAAYPTFPDPLVNTSTNFHICIYGTYVVDTSPVESSPSPANASTGKALAPKTNITVNTGGDIDTMNITWYNNKTGSWVQYGVNNSVTNGTYRQTASWASSGTTKYWWKCTVDDGITNKTYWYYFTTAASGDTTKPTMTFNFAGNHSDKGGPYWLPPGESTVLSGNNLNGYYTNYSKQLESGVYINVTAQDETAMGYVELHWMNITTHKFQNTTRFSKKNTNYYEINTSINSTLSNTTAGHQYSFDVCVYDAVGNYRKIYWNKTGLAGTETRRSVYLKNQAANVQYIPIYPFNDSGIITGAENTDDRLKRDQGPDGTLHDMGMLKTTSPSATMTPIWCGSIIGFLYDNDSANAAFTLTNVYFHVWTTHAFGTPGFTNEDVEIRISVNTSKDNWNTLDENLSNAWTASYINGSEYMHYDTGISTILNHNYSLCTKKLMLSDDGFYLTDNNIYQIVSTMLPPEHDAFYPSLISNRSIESFFIFNVPDNATLNASHADTDSDGYSDWYELYRSYTNPFTTDTDDDGVTDYDDARPNNYTNTSLTYHDTIRNDGVDYMVWLGTNITAYWMKDYITGFDEVTESISIWNRTTWGGSNGGWQTYNGTGTGVNWTVHTFDIIRTILTDSGSQTIHMDENTHMTASYAASQSIPLVNTSANRGYNFSAYNRVAATTLQTINTTGIGLPAGDFCTRWNRTTFTWDVWISGFGPRDYAVSRWDVIQTKVSGPETWTT